MAYRNEYKIEINKADLLELRPRLKTVLKPDVNAPNGKYKIRSLYFDTQEDSALMEKIDGHNNREKYRIRYYNDNPEFIRLEKKSKIKGLSKKESVVLIKEQALNILNGNFNFIKETVKPLLHDFYPKVKTKGLKPKSIVDYVREPYVFKAGNVRVTLDSDIRVSAYNPLSDANVFFDPDSPTIPVSSGEILLEVKWDEYLPDIVKDVIQLKGRSPAAFSKYALSRSFY